MTFEPAQPPPDAGLPVDAPSGAGPSDAGPSDAGPSDAPLPHDWPSPVRRPVASPPTVDRPTTARAASHGGSGVALVLAAAILSGTLASGGTAVILLATAPGSAPAGTPAPSALAASASPAGETVRMDVGDAIAAVAAAAEPSVVTISSDTPGRGGPLGATSGSGIVVSADGLILTTTVVAPTESTYAVLFADQREATARVVAADAAHGLVLLLADRTGLTPVALPASADLAVGQLVVAVGSPLGEFTDTVTAGIVSGLGRSIDLSDPASGRRVALGDLIQTDAAVNAGSSGGPLLDLGGTVVGIIATSASDGEGIGFAIPVELASALVAQQASR